MMAQPRFWVELQLYRTITGQKNPLVRRRASSDRDIYENER
jgi:hypothetical protein